MNNYYGCDCCGKQFDLEFLNVSECELVCEDCEDTSSAEEHTNSSRLSLMERNR